MRAEVNGWHTGATVRIDHEDGRDVVRVYRNGGSNAHINGYLIATWVAGEPIVLGKYSMHAEVDA